MEPIKQGDDPEYLRELLRKLHDDLNLQSRLRMREQMENFSLVNEIKSLKQKLISIRDITNDVSIEDKP